MDHVFKRVCFYRYTPLELKECNEMLYTVSDIFAPLSSTRSDMFYLQKIAHGSKQFLCAHALSKTDLGWALKQKSCKLFFHPAWRPKAGTVQIEPRGAQRACQTNAHWNSAYATLIPEKNSQDMSRCWMRQDLFLLLPTTGRDVIYFWGISTSMWLVFWQASTSVIILGKSGLCRFSQFSLALHQRCIRGALTKHLVVGICLVMCHRGLWQLHEMPHVQNSTKVNNLQIQL